MKYPRGIENAPKVWDFYGKEYPNFDEDEFKNYPRGGFIEDVILGFKVLPTNDRFAFWSAISMLSTGLLREAWFNYGAGRKTFLNFFTVFVAPPASGKSMALNASVEIEEGAIELLPEILKFKQTTSAITAASSPEGLVMSTNNKEQIFINEEGKSVPIKKNANINLKIEEFHLLVNNKKHNETMITALCNLYDCRPTYDKITVTNPTKLKNLFTVLTTATTDAVFKDTLPNSIKESGFLSRMTPVYGRENRHYSRPKDAEKRFGNCLPRFEELSERLAWIIENKRGEYDFDDEADEIYNAYTKRVEHTLKTLDDVRIIELFSRRKQHVLQMATMIALQKYEIDYIITKKDLELAIQIVEENQENSKDLIIAAQKAPGELKKEHLLQVIHHEPWVTRSTIMQFRRFNGHKFTAKDLHEMIPELMESGQIEMYREGVQVHEYWRNSCRSNDQYTPAKKEVKK